MDVTKILEQDHRTVEDLFERIEEADGDDRSPLIDELVTALRAHMTLEEQILYPAMATATGEETVEEGNAEHRLARKGLVDVVEMAPDEPGFGAALDSLKAGISHHVEDEEDEVFPKLRTKGGGILDEIASPFIAILDEIASPFIAKRLELGLPMEADALAAASSKDELVAEAESAGISGASGMTKAEVAKALAMQMS